MPHDEQPDVRGPHPAIAIAGRVMLTLIVFPVRHHARHRHARLHQAHAGFARDALTV
jgi:hypothetical protein